MQSEGSESSHQGFLVHYMTRYIWGPTSKGETKYILFGPETYHFMPRVSPVLGIYLSFHQGPWRKSDYTKGAQHKNFLKYGLQKVAIPLKSGLDMEARKI